MTNSPKSGFTPKSGFISVGAVCQRLRFGGGWSVLRRWAAGRVDSSLRSHRTWRSYCRHVCSGLNKTLYASVGPNSRCRSHRQTLPAEPESPGIAATFIAFLQGCCLSGRMNPSRGHRRDATRSLAWRAARFISCRPTARPGWPAFPASVAAGQNACSGNRVAATTAISLPERRCCK